MNCTSVLFGGNFNFNVNRLGALRQPSFRASRVLAEDTIDFNCKKTATTITDLNGNPIKATITEEPYDDDSGFFGSDPKRFTLYANGKELAYAISYNSRKREHSLFVKELFGEENYARHYRGAGTALLKTLVKESIKQGNEGRITLSASHVPPPFVFYYKNNFQVTSESQKQHNATIDYAARNNIPAKALFPDGFSCLSMGLDEKGAEALLKDERLYEKREFRVIDKFDYKGRKYEVNLVQSPDLKEYNLQIVKPEAEKLKESFCARLKETTDEDNKKVLMLYGVSDQRDLRNEYIERVAQTAAQALGCDYAVVSDEKIWD